MPPAQDNLWSGAQNIRAVRLPVPMAGSAVRWDIVTLLSLLLSLRYESSTLILYNELSSTIFHSLSVSQSVTE